MTGRRWPLESKAACVRLYLSLPEYADVPKKELRDYAVRVWKARKGNLNGRVHPKDRLSWSQWRSISDKRYTRRLQRWGRTCPFHERRLQRARDALARRG